jgi:hypothetical protein
MENSDLNWQLCGKGYLARPSHGCYLVYQKYEPDGKSILWLAKYKASGLHKQPRATLDFQRFSRIEDAKAACEEHTHRCLSPLRHGPSIEGVKVPQSPRAT